MHFDKPKLLLFLFILIPFILGSVSRYIKKHKSFTYLTYYISQKELLVRFVIIYFCYAIFFSCTIIALAGPRWGKKAVTEMRHGIDIVLAFDLSNSMNGADSKAQTRISSAKNIAQSLVLNIDGRFGTAIAKGQGLLALPLSFDTEAVLAFLDALSTSYLTGYGTNLENLIDAGITGFQDRFPTQRIIVLFSDGENLEGSPLLASERAAQKGITILACALGTEEGALVPNEAVISSLQLPLLQDITQITGGTVIDGNTEQAESILIEHLATNKSVPLEQQKQWHIFVVIGLTALIISGFLGKKSRGALVAFMLFFCSCSKINGIIAVVEGNFYYGRGEYARAITAYMKGRSSALPYAEFGLGAAYYALDEDDLALDRFNASLQATNNKTLQYRLHYNTGIIRFEQSDFESAANEFRLALMLDGSSIDAKRNLELTLASLAKNGTKQAEKQNSQSNAQSTLQTVMLFDYMREKEREYWKSQEWVEQESISGANY